MTPARPRTSPLPAPRVLIVDSDRLTARSIGGVLERAGFVPSYAASASQAAKAARRSPPMAVILSSSLPDMSAARLVRLLRPLPALRRCLILVLAAPRGDGLEVECLKSGADDFLVWGVNDLSALPLRLSRNMLAQKTAGTIIEHGELRVELDSRAVFVGKRRVPDLRPREFDLLAYLMRRSPAVATWAEIQRDVWRTPEHALDHGRETKTIAVHCDRLRQKLGGSAGCIFVRRGVGLQFDHGRGVRSRSGRAVPLKRLLKAERS